MTTTTATKTHFNLYVSSPSIDLITRSLCLVLTSRVPYQVVDIFAQNMDLERITCKACRKALAELRMSITDLVHACRTKEQELEHERAYETRRRVWQRNSFVESAKHIAARLRRLADETEGVVNRYFPAEQTLEELAQHRDAEEHALRVALEIEHNITWGVANLDLSTTIRKAAELDRITRVVLGR